MKKLMKIMAMAVVAVVMAAGFASCSKSDDNGINPSTSTNYYGVMKINLKLSDDVLSLADITVTYTDENSKEHTETLTTGTFTKDIKFNSLPAKALYKVSYKMKENLPNKESFDIAITDDSSTGKTDGTKFPILVLSKYDRESGGVSKDMAETIIKDFCSTKGFDKTLEK